MISNLEFTVIYVNAAGVWQARASVATRREAQDEEYAISSRGAYTMIIATRSLSWWEGKTAEGRKGVSLDGAA